MPDEFQDIKLTGMDENASRKPDRGDARFDVVLTLSASAPSEWANYFNKRWEQHIYMMKRRATVSCNRLTIQCIPDELENDHLPELKNIIAETNDRYREYLAAKIREERKRAEQELRDRENLSNVKNKLKFD